MERCWSLFQSGAVPKFHPQLARCPGGAEKGHCFFWRQESTICQSSITISLVERFFGLTVLKIGSVGKTSYNKKLMPSQNSTSPDDWFWGQKLVFAILFDNGAEGPILFIEAQKNVKFCHLFLHRLMFKVNLFEQMIDLIKKLNSLSLWLKACLSVIVFVEVHAQCVVAFLLDSDRQWQQHHARSNWCRIRIRPNYWHHQTNQLR